jgi:hypothetical protein
MPQRGQAARPSASNREPRNRALANILAAGDAALRLPAPRRLRASFCWCGVRIGLRPNLMPFASASARPRAMRSRMRRRSSFAAASRMARMISAESDVVSRKGAASERMPAGALHVAGDNQKVCCVAREAVNRRGDDTVARREGPHPTDSAESRSRVSILLSSSLPASNASVVSPIIIILMVQSRPFILMMKPSYRGFGVRNSGIVNAIRRDTFIRSSVIRLT